MSMKKPIHAIGGVRLTTPILEHWMNKHLAFLLLLLVLNGCATLSDDTVVALDSIMIDRVDSRSIRVGYVYLSSAESRLWVRGAVMRKNKRRGPISGHIHIDALSEDPLPLASVVAGHKRSNRKAQKARFAKKLDVDPTEVKAVRVTHHSQRHNHS